jgi:hypothetical protein
MGKLLHIARPAAKAFRQRPLQDLLLLGGTPTRRSGSTTAQVALIGAFLTNKVT